LDHPKPTIDQLLEKFHFPQAMELNPKIIVKMGLGGGT
jgi:hypothetical protein